MYRRYESSFESFDKTRIFYQGWESADPEAFIIVTHGQGEHSECYHRLVEYFDEQRFSFWAWDMRGHGKSAGIRGYANDFQDYVKDYLKFLEIILKQIPSGKPIFLLAHSMGALVQNMGLLERSQKEFQAQILSAPLFGIAVEVPAFKKMAAEWLQNVLPKITLSTGLKNEMLTRDPDVMREFDKDPLRHDRVSSGVYLGFLKTFPYILEHAGQIQLPTFLLCPEKDPVVSTEATLAWVEKLGSPDKKYLIYGDGARHEMFNDTHRLTVFKDLHDYLSSHLKESP